MVEYTYEINHDKLKRDIRKKLFSKGITQADLARHMSATQDGKCYEPQTIRAYLSGGGKSKKIAVKAAHYLGLDLRLYTTRVEVKGGKRDAFVEDETPAGNTEAKVGN